MPHSAFHDPVLMSTGELVLTGPVDLAVSPKVHLCPPVTIRFMLVQHLKTQRDPVIVDDVATWTTGENWEAMLPADRIVGIEEGPVRAIGVAILRWDADPPSEDPPAFETYTWCVTRNVVAQAAS